MKYSLSVLSCLTIAVLPGLVSAANVRGSILSSNSNSNHNRRRTQGGAGNSNNMNDKNNNESDIDSSIGDGIGFEDNSPPQQLPGGSGRPEGSLAGQASSSSSSNGADRDANGACLNKEFVDVVIIGAGMAGVSAAATLQETDPTLTYAILESTDRVGGRVRSHSFGVEGNTWTVEDGANWIYGDIKDNPVLNMMDDTSFTAPFNDYNDAIVYGKDGLPMDPSLYDDEVKRFEKAAGAAASAAGGQWGANHASFQDDGVVSLLAQNGWTVAKDSSGDLDFIIQWNYLDYEFAMADTSVRFFPSSSYEALLTSDERGFEFLPQTYFQTNVDTLSLKPSTRVLALDYDANLEQDGKVYKARVHTSNGVECTDYFAQRVISTVSAGVLNNELIEFTPSLQYSAADNNPMEMALYIKVFYQFDTQFWNPDHQFLRVVRDVEHRGHCHNWQNMAYQDFYPGSNIIRCELMTEGFEELLAGGSTLSAETLDSLLDPLRLVYGADAVGTPIDVYYPKLNRDANFGFGAYANWRIGFSFLHYANFYGGIETLVPYCQHNGCNTAGEWILHFSGSASCYDQAETVHGAFWAGERSANFVLRELGYDVDPENNRCDVNWSFLK